MSSLHHKSVFIDKVAETLVVGFIRLSDINIPTELMTLILLFYVMVEKFDKELCGEDIIVSDSETNNQDTVASTKVNWT